MPQMAPLNWMFMTIFFSFSLLISMMILFWNSFLPPKKLFLLSNINKTLWKW
ncbi:ATP synthase F0 subunit 8 (mitochondrion) [Tachypleus tridentatus]|uniref:ATP synthase F0 subunit 8 n=1 Tax=Tachypleus tridentatus TaxID=6853 RepID=C1KRJ5_TACTR|nr:ATP synthase F0 subunit 8 [Tachypleus tridentatus]ACO52902.1 ATP synthase F0 subunit 8 [Tachypleus tridentatus]AFH09296.1 ATP synthase F0 subunit 8 [Tachypleus tridentatus]WGU45256.1 ATP synthase F0 subunit 8 [Tachypleus tridentatus]